jgi:hypothetical protein
VTSEGLNGPFGSVGAFLDGRYELVYYVLRVEVGQQGRRNFIVEHLNANVVPEFAKECVGKRVGGA